MRKPDFSQILKVLNRKRPDRPTMFEFFLNGPMIYRLTGIKDIGEWGSVQWCRSTALAYEAAGYDYVTLHASNFGFQAGKHEHMKSISQNEGGLIFDRESFNRYIWNNPDDADYSRLAKVKSLLPEGMKVIAFGPGGVLENCISLCGYENLAVMVMDDPKLAAEIFDNVGSRLVRYYQIASKSDCIGAMISNDDWGFAQQTMLSPKDMRKFVFPWHKKIVQTIHDAGFPAILHSCGNLTEVMDDIIDDMGYDAKHSYEDKIQPVEEAYRVYGSRIAILGGLDVDFVCRSPHAQIQKRAADMLKQTEARGSYALGTGNSVPEYVPQESYLAMIQVANPEAKFIA
jgi:uroporphyrinogen decarboxylase